MASSENPAISGPKWKTQVQEASSWLRSALALIATAEETSDLDILEDAESDIVTGLRRFQDALRLAYLE